MLKKTLNFGMVFLALFFVVSCNGDAEPVQKEELKVGVLIFDRSDLFISSVALELGENLENKVDLIMVDSKNDQSLQNTQLRELIDKDMDVLIINVVNPINAPLMMDLIKKANIPTIFFNREPDLAVMKNYGNMIYVGTDAAEAGIMQGEMIEKIWKTGQYDRNNDGIFQYAMLRGDSENPEAMARTINSVKGAEDLGVKMLQVDNTYVCDWDRELAQDAMSNIMLNYANELELVIANNDSMALGAVDILQTHGYNIGDENKVIPVIGVDAIEEALMAIEKGFLSGTVKQNGVKMAEVISTLTLNKLNGKEFIEGVDIGLDESGVALRIPYSPIQ